MEAETRVSDIKSSRAFTHVPTIECYKILSDVTETQATRLQHFG